MFLKNYLDSGWSSINLVQKRLITWGNDKITYRIYHSTELSAGKAETLASVTCVMWVHFRFLRPDYFSCRSWYPFHWHWKILEIVLISEINLLTGRPMRSCWRSSRPIANSMLLKCHLSSPYHWPDLIPNGLTLHARSFYYFYFNAFSSDVIHLSGREDFHWILWCSLKAII